LDTAYGFNIWTSAMNRIREADDSENRWEALRDPNSGVIGFWFRQSPTPMEPEVHEWGTFAPGRVTRWNPFPQVSGQILVSVNSEGKLRFFAHTPRRFSTDDTPSPEPDWSLPFQLAGLKIDEFERVPPRYQRFMQLDHRAAWTGRIPGRTGSEVRIEAGTADGRISLWAMLEQDELEFLSQGPENRSGLSLNSAVFLVLVTGGLIAGGIVARRNLRAGRADRAGTLRLVAFAMVLVLVGECLRAHWLPTLQSLNLIYPILATALFYGFVTALLYLAVEPHARRIWPSMLVSWSRLLGRTAGWRDSQIGRSVLWGALAAAGLSLLAPLELFARSIAFGAPATPLGNNWSSLLGLRYALSGMILELGQDVTRSFFLVFLLVLGRMALRRPWPAVIATALVWVAMGGVVQETLATSIIQIVSGALFTGVLLTLALRQGVLALMVSMFATELALMARASDWQAWHARPALLALFVFGLLVAYGYWAVTPRQVLPGARSGEG
jgi:hypothetical protein